MPIYLGSSEIPKTSASTALAVDVAGTLSIQTQPTKLIYKKGETFDPTGMVVRLTTDYYVLNVLDYTYSPTTLTADTTSIIISYPFQNSTLTASLPITVKSYDDVLENNDWADIAQAAAEGEASTLWNLGDTKTFAIGSTTYTAMIVGFDFHALRNTDTEYDTTYNKSSKKAAITFIVKELQAAKRIHSTSSSATNYNNTEMAKTTLPALYNTLPAELQNVMRLPTYYCSKGSNASSSTQVSTTTCKIFLPSIWEIAGGTYGGTNDKTQLPYFANGGSKILKYNGSAKNYWSRNNDNDTSNTYYRYITNSGTAGSGNWTSATQAVNYTFLFCI